MSMEAFPIALWWHISHMSQSLTDSSCEDVVARYQSA